VWNNVAYSQGGAYLIEPCPGNPIDTLINELSLRDVLRPFSGDDTVELGGKMLARFWSGQAASPREQRAYDTYRRQMLYYAKHYPDMPTEDGSIDEYTKKLDTHSLKQEIESWIDGDVPPLMAAAIQYYCYSSFCAGWEEVSAAAGINFLAAEEYDLWVFPGGLGQVSHRLWQKIRDDAGPESFRPQCLVFDVRSHKKGVQVTYLDEEQKVRTLVGKAAAVACPKKFYQYVQDDLPTERKAAFDSVLYRSYVVANVLINHPAPDNFYDLFLLHNGQYPQNANEASNMHRIADALAATWVTKGGPRSVLTCYWPLPFDPTGLHHAFGSWGDGGAESLRRQAATQIHRILRVIDVPASAVEQIRVTRWGHAMPISQTGIYNAGLHNLLRAPIDDKIFFVHSDNWALPAFETTVLEAFHYRDAIDRAISVG
jgi:hypothetical protein